MAFREAPASGPGEKGHHGALLLLWGGGPGLQPGQARGEEGALCPWSIPCAAPGECGGHTQPCREACQLPWRSCY